METIQQQAALAEKFRPTAGFTMMEVLVAMLLLAGVGIAIASSMVSISKMSTPTPDRYVAHNLAREIEEDLSNDVAQNVWDSGGGLVPNNYALGVVTIDARNYDRNYTVSDVDANNDSSPDYRKARVTVNY